MKLLALSIERLAGLRAGLKLDPEHLTGRVRVLHGPNAIGKSSLVRALKALLWPGEASVQGHVELEARFAIEGLEWIVRREGALTRWTQQGVERPAPRLPDHRHASQMLVGLEDLGLGAEGDIQDHVQRELGGGYDLAAAEEALRPRPRAGSTEASGLKEAEQALRSARDAQDRVVKEEATLADLRRDLEAAHEAAKHVARLEKARDLAFARDTLGKAGSALSQYPEGIRLLLGDEAKRLVEIREELARARQEHEDARGKLGELGREIEELDLAEPLASEVLDDLRERVEALHDAETALGLARIAAESAAGVEARLVATFGPEADIERLASLEEGLDVEVEAFVRASEGHARSRSEIEAKLGVLASSSTSEPPSPGAIQALQSWLAAAAPRVNEARTRRLMLVIATLLALALTIFLVVQGPWWLALCAFLVLILMGGLTWLDAPPASASSGPTRAQHEASYRGTSEEPPASWTEDAVRARLDELIGRQARAALASARAEQRDELIAKQAALEPEAARLQTTRNRLAAQLGTTMSAPEGALLGLVRARQALRDARSSLAACTAIHDERARARAQALTDVNAVLVGIGASAVGDLIAARVRHNGLSQRSAKLESLRREHATASDHAARAQTSIADQERAIATLFAERGLASGDELELARRLGRLADWKDAVNARDTARHDVERLSTEVAPELRDATVERLDEELARARSSAACEQELAREVGGVEARISDARRGRALETALAARDTEWAKNRAAFEEARRGALACALLAEVREAHEQTSRPRLIEAANTLFTRFTHGRYEVRIPVIEGQVSLKAHDTQNAGLLLDLDKLSDGTRAQLLLAARLAYLREIEHGACLPVVLDDALATSDPERLREIGAALLTVAREEGRQFLVLTTDESDVERLRPEDATPGEVEATDLRAVRGIQAPAAARQHLSAPDAPRVPEPRGRSAREYAEALATAGMPVRPVDGHREVAELHLWWVLHHDLESLQRLLANRIEIVGAYENIARAGAPVADEVTRASIVPWIALARSVLEAWRVGRGRPIDRDVLERAGVSEKYLEGLGELASEVRGDAKAWCAVVSAKSDERAKRYQTGILQRNQAYFVEHGYLDERDALDREQAWEHVLARLPAHHGIAPADLRQRFELLWNACGGTEPAGTEPQRVSRPT